MTADEETGLGSQGWTVMIGIVISVAIVLVQCVNLFRPVDKPKGKSLSKAQLERRAELFREFWPEPPPGYEETDNSSWYDARTQEVIGRSISDWEELFSLADEHTQPFNDDRTSDYTFWLGEFRRSRFHAFVVEDGVITEASNGNISQ